MPSIHGICFDNGMSGHCDFNCEQFIDGDCDAYSDVIEGFRDELIDEYLDSFQKAVLEKQTKYHDDDVIRLKDMMLKTIVFDNFGYKY